MSDKQSNLTDKEMENLQDIVTDTLASVCAMADKHNIDRDSMLKYFADMLTAFAKVASIQNYETSPTCNCQHNSNSRDSEPCCRCDSKQTNAEIVKVDSLEIIVRMIGNKPYYEVKYREVGKEDYSVGYSSYDLKIVLGFIAEYFEIVERDRQTNADRIRNMSDEELAEFLDNVFNNFFDGFEFPCDVCSERTNCETCFKEWLQSEAE